MLIARYGASALRPASVAHAGDNARTILNHRTHRLFKNDGIPESLVSLIIACGFSAPSKSDLQQASIVRVRDPRLRKRFADLIPAMPWIKDSPEFFIMLADGRRISRITKLKGKPFKNDNLDNFISAVCDASLVMQNIVIAAEAIGLGCCPISVIRNYVDQVARILALPDRVFPLAGLCIGWPAREGHISMRLPQQVTMHENTYDDSDLEPLVEAYDHERDARFRIPLEQQRHIQEFGQLDFYSWSEDKARQMAREERSGVSEFVRNHGFSLR
ncbi:MAG: nitroreductase family protein [Rhodospirillales bacterium]